MKIPNWEEIKRVMAGKGHKVFDTPSGHDINIIGIRSAERQANRFDDLLTVAYRLREQWCFLAFPATTDPGAYWLEHPAVDIGTAILAPGQYRGSHQIGKHRGKYDALVQARPVTVYRDPDQDLELDTGGQKETGIFGINIHCAAWEGRSIQVDKWSAGCQVVQDWYDFQVLMALARAAERSFGNSFSYTLLEEGDFSSQM